MKTANIKEVFTSIQGEALYIGQEQIFIRFCGCNLHCDYCDTDFKAEKHFTVYNTGKDFENPVTPDVLAKIINALPTITVSLTGGEPLLHADFLTEFLPLINNKKIYLETNGNLPDELNKVIPLIDIVSMDIKLECSTKQNADFEKNEEFIKIAKSFNKEIFAKIVLNNRYDKDEISIATDILKKYDVPLIIQPMDCKDKNLELSKNQMVELLSFVTNKYSNTRLIPQVHKFLDLM